MTRDEFIERWKRHVAGMALFGVASEVKDGPLARAGKLLDLPAEVERLLGKMYDDATKPNGTKPDASNRREPAGSVPRQASV